MLYVMSKEDKYYDPPQWIMRLLRWFCADSFLEEVEGDLYELFQEEVAVYGLIRARRRFFFTAMRYIKPFFFGKKDFSFDLLNHLTMLRHYFKISTRHLLKQKFYSFINITGFAVGLACCFLILLYIRHELSYDQQHSETDQIYRVVMNFYGKRGEGAAAVTTTPVAQTMRQEFPEIIQAARLAPRLYEAGTNLVKKDGAEQNIYEEGFIYADPSFLGLFQLPMVAGELKTALTAPNTMVITARKAKLLFPDENPIGQSLILNNNQDKAFKVTGILEDIPENMHFEFDYLLSMEGLEVSKIPNWGFSNFVTYVKLASGTDYKTLENKFPNMIRKYQDAEYEKRVAEGEYFEYHLQPVKDIHLRSGKMFDYWVHSDIQYVWLFGTIAFFILLIAAINFMNLSTARSANRAKEVGLRKVLGSLRKQLMTQFLTESITVSLLAFSVALLLVWQALPYFNDLTGITLTIPWEEIGLLPVLLLVAIAMGILAGIYPSIFLSSFRPIQVLKGQWSMGSKSGKFRSGLVIFQFTISIVLIISSLVVKKQVDFIQNKKLGFEKDQLLIIEDTYTLNDQINTFKAELKNLPEIQHVSVSDYLPVEGYEKNGSGAWKEGTNPEDSRVGLAKWYVDHDYVKTMGMEILEGRDFSTEFPTDSQAIILNTKAVEMLELEDPIGKQISSYTYLDPETGQLLFDTYTVIGVVEDFHFESMKMEIQGLSLVIGRSTGSTMIKAKTTDMKQLIAKTEQIWESFVPDQPFRYNFLDERFASMYAFEQRAGNIFTLFTGLAILVACLGLFALATFMAEQRRKEIGIRKVLGASVFEMVYLLTKRFTLLVVIALLIAIPLAWYFMNNWLDDFAYQTKISWDIFLVSGFAALLIAILTISYQAVRAALANPVEAIRSE